LDECFGHAEIEWQKLSADAVVDFVRREAAKLQPISCGQPVTAMRAFLRFLTSTGFASAQGLAGPAFIPFDMFLRSVGWSNGTAPE
jgi:hypothetical protein